MVKVFLTGGTGFIGSRVVTALIAQGHTVSALSRRRGTALDELNVDVVLGSLRDLDTIAAAAAEADAVMHLGFQHDFTRYAECCQQDLQVVLAISRALAGSGKLFVSTSSTGGVGDTEDYLANDNVRATGERGPSERATLEGNNKGIRAAVLRLPLFVYAKETCAYYDVMLEAAQNSGYSSYSGKGTNKMSVVHVDDAVQAYLALLDHKDAHGMFNIPSENGVTGKSMAESIAAKLHCKVKSVSMETAEDLFGPHIAKLTSMNNQVDGSRVHRELGWTPQHTSFRDTI